MALPPMHSTRVHEAWMRQALEQARLALRILDEATGQVLYQAQVARQLHDPKITQQAVDEGIARLLKDDRDANFVQKTDDGKVVNRWTSTGMLAASAASNEAGYITHKVARSWGLLAFDNQARV